MRRFLKRLVSGLPVLVAILVCVASAYGQGGILRGRLFLPNGTYLNENVRISLETGRGVKSQVFTDNQGQFVFPGLTPGSYTLVIESDRLRYDTTSARIEVFGNNSTTLLNVVLRELKSSKAAKNGNSIAVSELDAAVPDKAKKEFERASTAAGEGKAKDAISHLRQAIAIYPRYLMALNDLGAQLLGLGKLDEAAEELRKALEIEPKAFNPNLNLGIVLVQQQKFAEAAPVLKNAVSLDASSPAARLYNGMALEGTSAFTEAERELKAAHDLGGIPFSLSLFHLGNVYLGLGDAEKARMAFKNYLREAPTGPKAAQTKTILASIK